MTFDIELDTVCQMLEAREEGMRPARIRFEGGPASETSYRQSQIELTRTITLVLGLERKISLKGNDVAFLVNEYPNKVTRGRLLQEFSFPQELSVGLPSGLFGYRPDIH